MLDHGEVGQPAVEMVAQSAQLLEQRPAHFLRVEPGRATRLWDLHERVRLDQREEVRTERFVVPSQMLVGRDELDQPRSRQLRHVPADRALVSGKGVGDDRCRLVPVQQDLCES